MNLASKKVLIPLLVLGALVPPVVMASHSFTNGNFETGDLSGWTTFTTSEGTLGFGHPLVMPFDTDGDGTATESAAFNVGQVVFEPDDFQGGGIHQSVDLRIGSVTISADIAASSTAISNDNAGKFDLLIDGDVKDSHNFGPIGANAIVRSTLAATVSIDTAGSYEIRIRMGRPQGSIGGVTPTQFIDNVVLSGCATGHKLKCSAIPGKGLNNAPGQNKDFNDKGKGGENAGKKK